MSSRIAIHGATGRMGQAIIRLISEEKDCILVSAFTDASDPWVGKPIRDLVPTTNCPHQFGSSDSIDLDGVDVVVDFSHPDATPQLLSRCLSARVPVLIGTTGHGPEFQTDLDQVVSTIPVILAANTSPGITHLLSLVSQTARAFPDADAEIVETHHRGKKDAPSGTALAFAQAIVDARDRGQIVVGRSGVQSRTSGEVSIASLRGGQVPGDHAVIFASDQEIVEIRHRAIDRNVFAAGAIRAAKWLARSGRQPGQYTMIDVLSEP